MCGVSGILDLTNQFSSEELSNCVNSMNKTLFHRGPDDSGIWVDKTIGIGIGHTRLSIIDLSSNGDQPMTSSSGRYSIVFNGEIYNFPVLRKNLLKDFKISFKGTSDTEVLLYMIEKYGMDKALQNIQGMYAFAIYDRNKNQIHLCRDRLGEKPLYYSLIDHQLYFSSELKPITNILKRSLSLDVDNINFFINKSYFPEGLSVFKEVQKVLPGTIITFNLDKTKVTSSSVSTYWNFKEIVNESLNNPVEDYVYTKNSLDDLFNIKVKERMISDVPLGAFLSGGYDSSLIVALMQKNSMNRVKSFSIGFNSEVHNEAEDSKLISQHLGTDHRELYVSDKELLETIYRLPSIYSEPFADSSQIPTVLLSDLTKTEVTVSLSGDGGDEIFGGYGRYFLGQRVINSLGKVPYPLRRSLKKGKVIDNFLTKRVSKALLQNSVSNFPQKSLLDIFTFIKAGITCFVDF